MKGRKVMFDTWLESLKNMGIFVVFAQTLIHFKPKGAYEKYIRLLVSIMLLVQLLEPVSSILGILQKGELQKRIRNMEYQLGMVGQQAYDMEDEMEDIWDILLQDGIKETGE